MSERLINLKRVHGTQEYAQVSIWAVDEGSYEVLRSAASSLQDFEDGDADKHTFLCCKWREDGVRVTLFLSETDRRPGVVWGKERGRALTPAELDDFESWTSPALRDDLVCTPHSVARGPKGEELVDLMAALETSLASIRKAA